ncbi:hypothetical protein GNF10_34305 [Nostoc sp. UCD121]|uniref:hypothetical protein n=1 Tax=unclassified Nostoc TaxID=2593658 RepID=UPI0016236A35|nr:MULTISPECIES: hypothetical protein [unclassified Nostoc]MBC1220754.1 hypothetical protein [Nostoc sp. UCD120]MBC1280872.1 hypothetical protein [Nostoc sp. UCD121]MBC1300048.1 hypothetical protein [Nostoc sp. UCD122]
MNLEDFEASITRLTKNVEHSPRTPYFRFQPLFLKLQLSRWLNLGGRRDTDTVGEFPKQLN